MKILVLLVVVTALVQIVTGGKVGKAEKSASAVPKPSASAPVVGAAPGAKPYFGYGGYGHRNVNTGTYNNMVYGGGGGGYGRHRRYQNGGYGNVYGTTGYNNGYGNTGYGNNGYGNNGYYSSTGYGYGNTGYGNNGYGNNRYGTNGYGNNGYGNRHYRQYPNQPVASQSAPDLLNINL